MPPRGFVRRRLHGVIKAVSNRPPPAETSTGFLSHPAVHFPMGKGRLELPRAYAHSALNAACLPIPPLALEEEEMNGWTRLPISPGRHTHNIVSSEFRIDKKCWKIKNTRISTSHVSFPRKRESRPSVLVKRLDSHQIAGNDNEPEEYTKNPYYWVLIAK